ncbi:MAG: RRXRR domain-containing protein [Nostoc sp. DedQUE08]|nr:RRXRR domain-containing protein [Nostoc sp. DedQUE08]MDZ8066193.1 RRXRR domain-containing protein [Nostoc sp. DedQUE08]
MRVSVLNPDGSPAMPTKPSRARRWLKAGKAKVVHNDLNLFCVQLICEPSGYEVQDIALGKMFTGIGVQSSRFTLFTAHLILPFQAITKKMNGRRILRRARRARRINRKVAFHLRAHRQKRFSNRRQGKLPPSIRANRQMELRVTKELIKLFPVSDIRYEVVKARTEKGKGRGFSPVMVGQKFMFQWLEELCPTVSQEGWQTSTLRQQLGLAKDKGDKSKQIPETHANDGIALAASHFMSYQSFQSSNGRGHHWHDEVEQHKKPQEESHRFKIQNSKFKINTPCLSHLGG